MERYVIFGGTGFIGTHLSQFLLEGNPECEVILVDLLPPRNTGYARTLAVALLNGRARFVKHDVRNPIDELEIGPADVVFNLAAVHREPGHELLEYFQTNIGGAENVCAYASAVGAGRMVFTSSISVYGPTEEAKTEESIPVPKTPYGSSKLVAESIHQAWQAAAPGRQLLTLRPGVVFGPGEGGNVTRLIRSLIGGYFVYMGNRSTRKAGGYVKELCEVIRFGIDYQKTSGEALTLLNFSTSPPASIGEFVDAIRNVEKMKRKPISLPRTLLLAASYVIDVAGKTLRVEQPVCPARIRKLFCSTNIEARKLQTLGYKYSYSLKAAFEDWKQDVPEDFAVASAQEPRFVVTEKTEQIPGVS
ncbi:MAG: NAD(P)-dependent oxidoreductase [Terracidiphilus sp.]|jgi:nucleoside-diphosphate-sugar epimerase